MNGVNRNDMIRDANRFQMYVYESENVKDNDWLSIGSKERGCKGKRMKNVRK